MVTHIRYTELLTTITAGLVAVQKAQGTKLLWVKTTPVPTVPMYLLRSTDDVSRILQFAKPSSRFIRVLHLPLYLGRSMTYLCIPWSRYGRMQPNGTICNDTRICLNPPRYDADVVLYNKAADVVMAKVRTNSSQVAKED